MKKSKTFIKALLLIVMTFSIALLGIHSGLTAYQGGVVLIFFMSILGALLFWDLRLGFMFVGNAVYLLTQAVSPQEFVHHASLDVILFLISIMIVVAMMKDVGLFEWLITVLLRVQNLTGKKLFIILMFLSAFFSSLMGEVASTVVMVMTIITICDLLEVEPVPLIICSVIATNIGSAATVLGNPVGILIAARAGLSFEDFLINALPSSVLNLFIVTAFLMVWFRKYIKRISKKVASYVKNKEFIQLITIPSDTKTKISIVIFVITIISIALHKRLELLLGLEENTLLMMFPMLSAGVVMFYRHSKAREYIEQGIEWPSIVFFMFLFAQAGVIQSTGVAGLLAKKILSYTANDIGLVSGVILFTSGALSSVLDNVVAVASYIPLIHEFDMPDKKHQLWWSLLFGACYGGNITMIGSTANIVALGLLEKHANKKIVFWEWFKIGLPVGIITFLISYGMLLIKGS